MKRFLKIATLIILVILVGIQFIPTNRNQSDETLTTDFMRVYNVPNNVRNLIQNSCYDCHSNNTNYPWYNKIQPISWFLEDHIKEAKSELNFSEFGSYSKRRKRNKLKSILNQIKKNEMPLSSYTFIHSDAKFSEKEKIEIIRWINKLKK